MTEPSHLTNLTRAQLIAHIQELEAETEHYRSYLADALADEREHAKRQRLELHAAHARETAVLRSQHGRMRSMLERFAEMPVVG